jgi:hypothetical protein
VVNINIINMDNKVSTIIFLLGMTGISFSYAMLMRVKGDNWDKKKKSLGISILVFLVIIVISWVLREYNDRNEKFKTEDSLQRYYNQFDQKGQRIIAGTVFTDYPPEVPGLGWVL